MNSKIIAYDPAKLPMVGCYEDLVNRAKKIADESFDEAAVTDSTEKFPVDTLTKIAQNGLLTAGLPEAHKGAGLGIVTGTHIALLQILKHLGRGNLVIGRVYEGHLNALLLSKLFGSDKQMRSFAGAINKGGLSGVWNTQADDGVSLLPLKNNKFRLLGAKIFATGVDFVTHPIVTGMLPDGGWQMTCIPLKNARIKIDTSWWNPMGMRATRSFKVDFSGVEIGKDQFIGTAGDYYRQPWFSGGAIRYAAAQLGAATAIFDQTRSYLKRLNRIDDPYQKMRLGEMAILVESGNLWLESAAQKSELLMEKTSELDIESFLAYVNMFRLEIEKICEQVMTLCVKSVGARGLNQPFHMERIIRDLTIYLRQPAPDAALAEVGAIVLKTETATDELWKTLS